MRLTLSCITHHPVGFPAIGGLFIGEELSAARFGPVVPLSFFSLLVGCREHKSYGDLLRFIGRRRSHYLLYKLGHEIMGELGERFFNGNWCILAFAHMQAFHYAGNPTVRNCGDPHPDHHRASVCCASLGGKISHWLF